MWWGSSKVVNQLSEDMRPVFIAFATTDAHQSDA